MKTIITILITILCLANVFAQKKFKTDSGFVFIDGKYIEPPYNIEIKDTIITLNGIKIFYKPINLNDIDKYIVDNLPVIPDSIWPKMRSLDDFYINYKVPGLNVSYSRAIYLYLFTHYNFEKAKKLYSEYYTRLSFIDSVIIGETSLYLYKHDEKMPIRAMFRNKEYYDEIKQNINSKKSLKNYKNKIQSEYNASMERLLKVYFENIIYNKVTLFGSDENYCDKINIDSEIFIYILDSLNKLDNSIEEKINDLKKYGSYSNINGKYISLKSLITNFSTNTGLIQKYKALFKDKNINSKIKNNDDINELELNKTNNIIPTINNISDSINLQTKNIGDINFSPKSNKLIVACPSTFEFAFSHFDENSTTLSNSISQFGYTIEKHIKTNLGQTFEKSELESFKNAGILLWSSHGTGATLFDNGLLQVGVFSTQHDCDTWINNDSFHPLLVFSPTVFYTATIKVI